MEPLLQEEREASPISIYLSYDYLPLNQQAKILDAISGIYETLLQSGFKNGSREFHLSQLLLALRASTHAPLCIVSAHTGESIRLKFDIERKFLPKFVVNDGDLDILVPAWTAAAVITGSLLIAGLHGYKEVLEIQKLQYEIDGLQSEREEEQQRNTNIEMYLNQFYMAVNQDNINKFVVNGHSIKDEKS